MEHSDRRKRILYVVEAMGGGVFTYIVDLANELVNEFDVYIAYAIRPQTPSNYKEYFDKKVHLIEVKSFCREIKLSHEMKAIKELRAIEKEVKPDIIHLHSSKAGVIGRIAFDGKDIPVFYTPHGYSFLMANYKFVKRQIFKIIETAMAKRKCMTISCSLGEHQETLRMTHNATYVNNAINVEKLKKCMENIKKTEHPFTVFTLGRICYQKNPSLFNAIAKKMPNTKFLWIGDGELRNELQSDNIEITGWVNREEALKRSLNADVFVLTSLWEGLPLSLLEAMYMKKICVVSDVIGNRDVIRDGKNGYICRNVADYIRAIEERREECAEHAYQDIIDDFNVKGQAEKYAQIYRKNGIRLDQR